MIIDAITSLILQWCEVDNKNYSKVQKEECTLYLANCIINFRGTLEQDENKLSACINNGKRRLYDKSTK